MLLILLLLYLFIIIVKKEFFYYESGYNLVGWKDLTKYYSLKIMLLLGMKKIFIVIFKSNLLV